MKKRIICMSALVIYNTMSMYASGREITVYLDDASQHDIEVRVEPVRPCVLGNFFKSGTLLDKEEEANLFVGEEMRINLFYRDSTKKHFAGQSLIRTIDSSTVSLTVRPTITRDSKRIILGADVEQHSIYTIICSCIAKFFK